jgi:hypothetical protein
MTIKRVLSCLPALALLAALLPVPTRADDVGDLLAKHKAYVGFTFGDGSITTLATAWSVTRDKDGVRLYTGTDKYVGILSRSDETDLKAHSSTSSGFTGHLFWHSNENGFTVPIIGDPAKRNFDETLFFSDAISMQPWTLGNVAQIDGGSYRIVHVNPALGLPADLYLDPATGAFKRIVIDPGGDFMETLDVLAYTDALPGEKIVSKWKIQDTDATVAYTHISANEPITADALHPPPETAVWAFDHPQPFPIEVTPDRFIVKAKMNGVEGTFILDSGASNILLSNDFARRAKIKELGGSVVGGITGDFKVRSGRAATIDIGGNILSNAIVNYGGEGFDDKAPDGLLGFDVFAAALVTLDVPNATLQLQDPTAADMPSIHGVKVAVDLSDGTPHLPVYLNGTARLYAMLDSGDSIAVLVSPEYLSKNHVNLMLYNWVAFGGADGGSEFDWCGRISITLGPISYQHAGACRSSSVSGGQGLLGFDFLKDFGQIVFDYPLANIVFVPQH